VPPRHHQRVGSRGERLAAAWYEAAGYEVVARNWRCRAGELDLVLRRGDELVFCEVKTRTSDRFGVPAEAVTEAKQQRMRVLAARFLAESGVWARARVRFDVVCVVAGRVQVIEAAF
jgi:putative endonuclease